MKVLHLTLKKKWFDMIASCEKKEEYRDLKIFYAKRLCNKIMCDHLEQHLFNIDITDVVFKEFDAITFSHGYKTDRPFFNIEFKGIEIRTGKPEWGAESGKEYFVIKLGEIINP